MAVKHDSAATPWKQLAALAEQNTAAENVLAQLTLWLPKIDAVLHSGGTQPKDFTLHDDAHALQVAQRMDQILTDTSRDSLSCYELALLLLSGWLHDIGMVPEVARFALHRDYLLTGSRDSLASEDHAAFQKYLDDRSDSPRVPFITGTPTTAELDHADLKHLGRYLHHTLLRVPCRFITETMLEGMNNEIATGWVRLVQAREFYSIREETGEDKFTSSL